MIRTDRRTILEERVRPLMPPEFITIAGTLGAALIAGIVSYLAGRGMKTHEWRLALAKEELASRKTLYAAFLAEAQRLVIQASERKVHEVSALDQLSRQYAEITLVGSKAVCEAAMHVFDQVLLANVQEQTTEEALRFHPRKAAFLNAARAEIESLRAG